MENQGFEAIIFDLDDTLVKIDPEYIEGIKKEVSEGLDVGFTGTEEQWQKFDQIDLERRKNNCSLYPDVISALSELKERGIKLGIITSTYPPVVDIEIEALGLKKFFDSIVYTHRNSGFGEKPNPAGLIHLLEILNVKPEKAAYIGDNNRDLLTAKNADVVPIYITHESETPKLHPGEERVKNYLKINSFKELVV